MSPQELPPANGALVARKAREQFVQKARACLAPMFEGIRTRLSELAQTPGGAREMQDRRDAMLDFDGKGAAFVQGAAKAWMLAVDPPSATARVKLGSVNLELVGEDVVERKILSSRLALVVQEKAVWELNDLKVRMQHLDGEEQAPTDILRPEALCQMLVEQWGAAGLTRESWALVQDVVQRSLADTLPKAYKATNEFLVAQNVMRDIDLSVRVRRAASPQGSPRTSASPEGGTQADSGAGGFGPASGAHGGVGGDRGDPSSTGRSQGGGSSGPVTRAGAGYNDSGSAPGDRGRNAATGGGAWRAADSRSMGVRNSDGDSQPSSGPTGVSEETRMMTSRPPLARARARATGVLGQLRRLLSERVPGFDGPAPSQASAALTRAMERPVYAQDTVVQSMPTAQEPVYDNAAVQEVAVDLRRQTGELKKKAETSSEKATIEIVALMFQSILAEERIPPTIRVWFARLQMPVLRVAIAEPDFFGSLEHPARQLIDRLGSCVMGFDAAAIGGTALEVEIKRVVQVIEQYPETGRRVFKLVYDEFEKFLSRYLTEGGSTQKLVSVAQQVEQKETLAIQYTIELRAMLADMPIREEIRDFLFKEWAEVLALAAVRQGAQHEQTLSLKAAASELVWAASAKPNRTERAKVIQDLPGLLQRLRQGMTMVGTVGQEQEAHIKTIGETLADAFMSKTEAIPHERIEAMARRLSHLEDFVADDPATDLPLDRESIEMMLGIDASMIEVVADGGSKPNAAMLAWAAELQLGNWFTLDHNGASNQVQYVWRSDRGQLHLFAAPGGRSYLVQARRLAAYLQAGLLLPAEEEALTVRATRDALAKLDANPERLLH